MPLSASGYTYTLEYMTDGIIVLAINLPPKCAQVTHPISPLNVPIAGQSCNLLSESIQGSHPILYLTSISQSSNRLPDSVQDMELSNILPKSVQVSHLIVVLCSVDGVSQSSSNSVQVMGSSTFRPLFRSWSHPVLFLALFRSNVLPGPDSVSSYL